MKKLIITLLTILMCISTAFIIFLIIGIMVSKTIGGSYVPDPEIYFISIIAGTILTITSLRKNNIN